MKYYQYTDPDPMDQTKVTVTTVSEEDIIGIFFDYWAYVMKTTGKANLINYQNCIADFITVHLADEVIVKEI